jgi:hypothetical protein
MHRSASARGIVTNLGEVALFVRELRQQIDNIGEAKRPHELAQDIDGIALPWCACRIRSTWPRSQSMRHTGAYTIYYNITMLCASRRIAAASGDLTGQVRR